MATRETAPEALDCFAVKVRGNNGQLSDLAVYTNLQAGLGYQQYVLDLNAYLGLQVQLSFVATNSPKGLGTGFALDDVSLIAQ